MVRDTMVTQIFECTKPENGCNVPCTIIIESDIEEVDYPEMGCLKNTDLEKEWKCLGVLLDEHFGELHIMKGTKEQVLKRLKNPDSIH